MTRRRIPHAHRFALAGLSAAALTLAACGGTSDSADTATNTGTSTPTSTEDALSIVATTTILGSVAGDVATCAGGSVTTLMPVGADPHDFTPSSAQVAQMVSADVVIANGLGLEEGLADALSSAQADGARVIEVAELVDPIEFGSGGHSHEGDDHDHGDDHSHEGDDHDHGDDHSHEEEGHSEDEGDDHSHEGDDHSHDEEGHSEDEDKGDDHDHGHDHGSLDPHFWFDMNRMADAAVIIGDDLAELGGPTYAECGQQVAGEIRAAESEVAALLESVPADKRILVTDHDAFGYLADAYGYEVAGVVIPGGSTLAEPSSAQLRELVEVIQAEGVPAIFANTAEPSTLADAVAAEAGNGVEVVVLYVGSLGEPGSGADTYISMMLTDAELIANALRD
jgi:zinc/manganese transport system substrate-binding protein